MNSSGIQIPVLGLSPVLIFFSFFTVFKPEELDLLLDRSDLTWSKQREMMEEKDREEGNRKKKAKIDSDSKKSLPVKTSIFKVINTEGVTHGLPSVNK